MGKKKKEKDFEKEIEERMTTSFSISNIPIKEFKKFKKLAQDEFRNNYAMTLKFLMNKYEDTQFILQQLNAIWKEISKLKDNNELIKQKPKTFGGENV